jgi:hypothetical protein
MSEGEVFYVCSCCEHSILHLLLVVLLQPVPDMLSILATAPNIIARQGRHENHLVMLDGCQICINLPKEAVLQVLW